MPKFIFIPSAAPSFSYFLDTFTGAHSGFSFRKLSSTYTGSCMRAIRLADSTVLDIGFVNNVLDEASLLSFANQGGIYSDVGLKTWYDQSGNGNDYAGIASGSGEQKIVISGSVVKENSKPSIDFDLGNGWFDGDLSVTNNKPALSIISVSKKTGSSAGALFYASTNTSAGITRVRFGYDFSSNKISLGGRRLNSNNFQQITSSSNYTTNLECVMGVLDYGNSDAYLYLNGSLEASSTSFQTDGNTPSGDILEHRVGRVAGNNNILEGNISEFIVYETSQQANASAINTEIDNFYSL